MPMQNKGRTAAGSAALLVAAVLIAILVIAEAKRFASPNPLQLFKRDHRNSGELSADGWVTERESSTKVTTVKTQATGNQTYSLGEVHLALTHDPTQMIVQFTVFPNATESDYVPHKVVYYPDKDDLSNRKEVITSMYRYNITQMCGDPANKPENFGNPGTIHTAVLTGLIPGKAFNYQPRRFYEDGSAYHYETFTAVADFNRTRPYSAILFGDMGTHGEAVNNMKHLVNKYVNEANLVLHVGDVAYARGKTETWTKFMNMIQPVASRIPWMVNCGNHDCLYDGQPFQPNWLGYFWAGGDGGECAVPYNARFHMPADANWTVATDADLRALRERVRNKNIRPSVPYHQVSLSSQIDPKNSALPPKNNIFYSFNHGPIHYVMISTEHDMTENSVQYAWLEADLAKVNRSEQHFIVVGMHRPLYDVTICGELLPETAGMRQILEPLLLKYKVDVVVHGHYHQYERTCALAKEKCVDPTKGEAGPTYLIVGTGGKATTCPWGVVPEWSKYLAFQFGFVQLTVESPYKLTGQFIESVNGTVIDTFEIVRGN